METFTSQPLYILVGKQGKDQQKRFYQGRRDVRAIASLEFDATLEKLSLIIPSLLHSMPTSRNLDGSINFDDVKSYIRYFGLTDLDMSLEKVLIGREQIIANELPRVFENMDHFKSYWGSWLKEHAQLTVGEIRALSSPFDKVCKDGLMLAEALEKKGLHYLFYFSGLKGFRVLWYDPQLFYWVFAQDDFASAYKTQIAEDYFTGLGCDLGFAHRLDVSVYDKAKGIKPDVLAHPDSRLFSWLVQDYKQIDSQVLVRLVKDPVLITEIKLFWTQLPKQCPLTIKHLRSQGQLQFTGEKRKRLVKISDEEAPLDQEQLVDWGPVRPQYSEGALMLSDEFKKGIVTWMRKKMASKAAKNGLAIPFRNYDPFPGYRLKPYGGDGALCLTIDGWNYCGIAAKDHSYDKVGKVYFMVKDGHISQKCHSDKCRNQREPVYTTEGEKDRMKASNAAALATSKRMRLEERKQQQSQAYTEFKARPVSPMADETASRSAVLENSRSSYTESPNASDNARMEFPVVKQLASAQEPEQRTIEVDWHRHRWFETRLACKQYYLDQFHYKDSGPNVPVYPLIVEVGSAQQLQGSYVLVNVKKLETQAYKESDDNYHFYVVTYHEGHSCCWGILSKKMLRLKEGDPSQYLILRRKCYGAVTLKQAFKLCCTNAVIPNEIQLEEGTPPRYHRIVPNEQEQRKWVKRGYEFKSDGEGAVMYFNEETSSHIAEVLKLRLFEIVGVSPWFLKDNVVAEYFDNYESLLEAALELCPVAREKHKEECQQISLRDQQTSSPPMQTEEIVPAAQTEEAEITQESRESSPCTPQLNEDESMDQLGVDD